MTKKLSMWFINNKARNIKKLKEITSGELSQL